MARSLAVWRRPPPVALLVGSVGGLGMAAGFVLGVQLERASTPEPAAAHAARASERATAETAGASGAETAEALESALLESWIARLRLGAKLQELQSLAESGSDLSGMVDAGIASLSDRELRSILASTVRLGPDEIGEVADLRAFSARLAEIAMADIVQPEVPAAGASPVVFTTDPDAGDPVSRSRFRPGAERIYAVFPTDRFEGDSVMVKWYRRDRPQILLFQRYPVVAGDPSGYVWLRPADGWDPGQYSVNVYTGDETMTPLASGHYWVQD